MIIKLKTGIVAKGVTLELNDVVDWQSEDEARLKVYRPAPPRPEDRWPPKALEPLKRGDGD